jgi:LacI family transcriptional regulator
MMSQQQPVYPFLPSRVLNDKDDVALETSEHVKKYCQMGYTSSLAARSMRSLKTDVIGLIMPDVEQPYPLQVMRGVNRAVAEKDYDLIVYTSGDIRKNYTADRERHYVALLNNSITDGVIVVAPAATDFSTAAPVVAVDHSQNARHILPSSRPTGKALSPPYLICLPWGTAASVSSPGALNCKAPAAV